MSRKAAQILVGVLMLLGWGLWGAYGIPTARLESLVNYPNPFDSRQSETFISYVLDQDAPVTIRLFDVLGGHVRNWELPAGADGARGGLNRVPWDGTDEGGHKVPAGGYVCQVMVTEDDGLVQGIRKIGLIR